MPILHSPLPLTPISLLFHFLPNRSPSKHQHLLWLLLTTDLEHIFPSGTDHLIAFNPPPLQKNYFHQFACTMTHSPKPGTSFQPKGRPKLILPLNLSANTLLCFTSLIAKLFSCRAYPTLLHPSSSSIIQNPIFRVPECFTHMCDETGSSSFSLRDNVQRNSSGRLKTIP